jgi:uncharacterized protein YbjT (DUF2867 family)
MKILLTGATGYIAQRFLPVLLEIGHQVVCCVTDKGRFDCERYNKFDLHVIEVDFLNRESLNQIPDDIDAAYYLMHSMSGDKEDFSETEKVVASNFKNRIEETNTRQVIFLSGIVNSDKLSKHLSSRQQVEDMLFSAQYGLTTLRAGIIVGSGSASFEIIRDLVEKLPLMIAPKWLNTRCQPIAIRDVLSFLSGVLMNENTFNKSYDIAGPEILTYKEMLLRFAKKRGLVRKILIVPVMTPRLSSYWLYFVTSISYTLATNLVESMKVDVVARPNDLQDSLGVKPLPYEEAIQLAFGKIEQNQVISSWRDAMNTHAYHAGFKELIEVPQAGCFTDKRSLKLAKPEKALDHIWSIVGKRGGTMLTGFGASGGFWTKYLAG